MTEAIVRQRKKLAEGTKVTEDMCVTHFLIQPDPEGVKLQGWNERAFSTSLHSNIQCSCTVYIPVYVLLMYLCMYVPMHI